MAHVFEVFYRFLALGCVSFGGPAAHIGYFQTAFVQKLQWIDQKSYGNLVALSQFLPGPGSSQVGFAIGLRKAGLLGGMAAFLGFTLPSFLLLYFLVLIGTELSSHAVFIGVIYGLKLLAVIVVADACLTMFKAFCKNGLSIALAVFSTLALLLLSGLVVQIGVLVVAAIIGIVFRKSLLSNSDVTQSDNKLTNIRLFPLIVFFVLLLGLPWFATNSPSLNIFSDFYYSGSMVFGGGHVVLPLLQQSVGDSLSADQFLTGYAAAQAVPGPMFTLASYLGGVLAPEHRFLGAILATAGIFLPGFLLVFALQDAWQSLSTMPRIFGAAAAINAAVVGILVSALYQPIAVSAIGRPLDMVFVVLGFIALRVFSVPIVLLVIAMAVLGVMVQY